MRRAEYIAAKMLEHSVKLDLVEDHEGETTPPGSVVALLNGALTYSKTLPAFQAQIQQQGYQNVDQFVGAGGALFIRDNSGSVRLVSSKLPVLVGPEAEAALEDTFRFTANTHLGYQARLKGPVSDRPFSACVARALQRTQEAVDVPGHDGRNFVSELTRSVPPYPHRFVLGFGYPPGTENGVLVRVVDAGKAAAKAGLKPNDVIRATGLFATANGGSHPAVSIHNGHDLEVVLSRLAPRTVLPLKVIRGGGEVTIALVPELAPPQQQRAVRLPALTQPNDASPAGETGNQQANVSAIT